MAGKMKVSELIQVLSKLPSEMEVAFRGEGPGFKDSQGRMQTHYYSITDIYQVRSIPIRHWDGKKHTFFESSICELSDATLGCHSPYFVDGEEYRTLLFRDWD